MDFTPNLVYAFILWRSGLGLLLGDFHQFLTELFALDKSAICFRMETSVNMNKFSPNLLCALIQ